MSLRKTERSVDPRLEQEVRLVDDHVLVCNRAITSIEYAAQVCERIDRLLDEAKVSSVLFDTRETPAPDDAVREFMWAWCKEGTHHDRLAIVARSELTRLSGNMTAISRGVKLKSFATVGEAVEWLNKG